MMMVKKNGDDGGGVHDDGKTLPPKRMPGVTKQESPL
jgi:hypothetical protein